MSDHSESAVAPVEAYEPPYYVAVFTSVRTEDQDGREAFTRAEAPRDPVAG